MAYGLETINGGCISQKSGKSWTWLNGDSCELVKAIPDDSIHYQIFSPPFSSLYTYSNSDRDMGNCKDESEFFTHFGFLIQQLYRVIKPGRLCSFHCMNLPTSKAHHGYIGIRDFRGDCIRAFEKEGWIFHSEVCIWKDPVTAMQRTKALGLLHKQLVKDSCMSRQGIPDYVVTMRKPGENPERVSGKLDHFAGEGFTLPAERFERYQGAMQEWESEGCIGDEPKPESFGVDSVRTSIDIWQRYASPVWMDINPSNTLQYRAARDEKDARHICPLQLDVIHRCLQLWTNPGDVVLSPFGGIASEGYESIKMGRKFVGVELKGSYWEEGLKNLKRAEEESKVPELNLVYEN